MSASSQPLLRHSDSSLPPIYRVFADPRRPQRAEDDGMGRASRGSSTLRWEGYVYRIGAEAVARLSRDEIAARLLNLFFAEGMSGYARVIGEFTAVVTDATGLSAFRSLTSPFHVYFADGAVANHLLPLVRTAEPVLDDEYFLQFLIRRGRLFLQSTRTPFQGISRVPSGHWLRLSPEGNARLQRLETPELLPVDDPKQRIEDVVPELRTLMGEIIRDRLDAFRGRELNAQLSGGLDSSYVCALLGERGADLRTWMYSFPQSPSHRFSEACAQEVADRYRLPLRILPPEHFFPRDLATTFTYADEPTPFYWQGAVFGARLREHLSEGAVMFCGSGSDQIFYRQPGILPWLLRRGKWRAFRRTLSDCSKHMQRGQANLTYQSLLATLPPHVYTTARAWGDKLPVNPIHFEDVNTEGRLLDVAPWLRIPSPAKRQGAIWAEERAEHTAIFGDDAEIRTPLNTLTDPQLSMVPYLGYDKHYAMPFYDPRLLHFVYGRVSWHLVHDWGSPYKALLRAAQQGTVPDMTRTRAKNEFHFTGFHDTVLQQNAGYLRTLLHDLDFDRAGVLDRDALRDGFERRLFGFNDNAARGVSAVLSFAIWWRDFRRALHSRPA